MKVLGRLLDGLVDVEFVRKDVGKAVVGWIEYWVVIQVFDESLSEEQVVEKDGNLVAVMSVHFVEKSVGVYRQVD